MPPEENKIPTPPEDGKGAGKSKDEESENIKALHQKLSEKDVEFKKALAELETEKTKVSDFEKAKDNQKSDVDKRIDKMVVANEKLVEQLDIINKEKRDSELSKKYPDIAVELITSLSDDQIEKVVEKQRDLAKEKYGDSDYFKTPEYSSTDEIDAKILKVKEDASLTGSDKALEILNLTSERENFNQ